MCISQQLFPSKESYNGLAPVSVRSGNIPKLYVSKKKNCMGNREKCHFNRKEGSGINNIQKTKVGKDTG